MKKSLLFIALITMASTVSAQVFGIKAGVNLASMTLDIDEEFGDDVEKSIFPLLNISAIGAFELSQTVDFTLEIGLIQRGMKISMDDGEFEGSFTSTFNQFMFSPGIAVKPVQNCSIGFGPYIGYANKLKSTESFTDGTDSEETTYREEFDEDEKIDYGLNLSLNYLINDTFLISGGYSLGLKDYYEDSDYDEGSLMNRGVLLSVGYLFN